MYFNLLTCFSNIIPNGVKENKLFAKYLAAKALQALL